MSKGNIINGLVTDPTLSSVFKRVGNGISNGSDLQNRPIGIVNKNYNFLKNTLQRNIGSSIFDYDGYGTPISMLCDTDLTSKSTPWFLLDTQKKTYDNYLRYINDTYYQGFMTSSNFMSIEEKMNSFDRNSLLYMNNQVGAIRGYNMFSPNEHVQTNPNGNIDTQLGKLNNFYLKETLNNANAHSIPNRSLLTKGAYGMFGLNGQKGISDWEMFNGSDQVFPQELLTFPTIPWTPLTHGYGFSEEETPFGRFYNTTSHSDGLIYASSNKVQSYITKSMYGYDLLTDFELKFSDGIDYNHSIVTKKKYYATPYGGHDYISHMVNNGVGFLYGNDNPYDIIAYELGSVGNGNSASRTIFTYAEAEYVNGKSAYNTDTVVGRNDGINYGKYHPYHTAIVNSDRDDIINYTNKKFINGKYKTLIGRFHTEPQSKDGDMLSSAVSKYGMSHGRNLLKAKHEGSSTNGYSDPYCRVWTFHKQYSRLVDAIRPFMDSEDGETFTVKDLAQTEITSMQPNRARLRDNTVKFQNGLVRCAPTKEDDIKKCMFSIENLAWKNETKMMNGYEKGQKGPLGGRIMWFPPYELSFSEQVQVGWNSTQFIGRGENIYTYTNTDRSGTLNFKLLIDHPSIINNYRTEEKGITHDVDDVDSTEQKLLRFFAGCQMLENPIESSKPKEKQQVVSVKKVETVNTKQAQPLEINFYVFFPNNYSGVDDRSQGVVKPIEYLVAGYGAQKYIETSLSDGGIDTNADNALSKDLPTTLLNDGIGYEMRFDTTHGISNIGDEVIGGEKNNKLIKFGGGYSYAPYRYVNKNNGVNYWGYRVDERFANQVLRTGNYIDKTSYALNSEKGYKQLLQYHTDAQELENNGILYSFATIINGIDSSYRNSGLFDKYCDSALSDGVAKLIDTYTPVAVEVHGFASEHGINELNQKLSDDRAHTIMNWLNECNPNKFSKDLLKCGDLREGPKMESLDVSSLEAKVWRCSKVRITFAVEDVTINGEPQKSVYNVQDYIAAEEYNRNHANIENKMEEIVEEVKKTVEDDVVRGYNDEYKFFSELEVHMPFLHNKIKDKIKYFDPAFHSITPEGFNSRLTFLHQCTRQGSTTSVSDIHSPNRTASNLSFGTPPICVLRIGDFYNTKILIESLQIQYDDTTWDLNDEGIGVMPMMATISIGFKFLGGSDLSGPIARLQNAVSFNYYANTGVYDQRAEQVEYDKNGKIIKLDTK